MLIGQMAADSTRLTPTTRYIRVCVPQLPRKMIRLTFPFNGVHFSDCDSSSFLRGQNVPVDAWILAEREMKRRQAVELQRALLQQVSPDGRNFNETRRFSNQIKRCI